MCGWRSNTSVLEAHFSPVIVAAPLRLCRLRIFLLKSRGPAKTPRQPCACRGDTCEHDGDDVGLDAGAARVAADGCGLRDLAVLDCCLSDAALQIVFISLIVAPERSDLDAGTNAESHAAGVGELG